MQARKARRLVLLLSIMAILAGCSSQPYDTAPKAVGGRLDLSRARLDSAVVRLDGEWEFYRNQFLEPGEIPDGAMTEYIDLPSSWNQYLGGGKGDAGDGYATYKLTFYAPGNDRLALKIPKIRTAYKLWINGELRASAGTVGNTVSDMTPQYLPQVATFPARQGENEIVVQVSNFYERSGGMLESILIGSEREILGLRNRGIANDVFLFGALFVLGIYHFALYLFRRKNRAPLFFGLFCILIAIRTLLIGECFLIYLFPEFNWEIARKIQTTTFYLGVPLIIMFFASSFPSYWRKWILRATQLVGLSFSAVVIFTPSRVFTVINPAYQIWSAIVITYLTVVCLKIGFHREKGSWAVVCGGLAFLVTSLNDIVALNIWLNDSGPSFLKTLFSINNLSSVGLVIFAVANSLFLAGKFSDSLAKEEILAAELTEINANLDGLVLQRTKALEESKERIEQQKLELVKMNQELYQLSVKDPLTGLWNRRKYDETINLEWNRCRRHQRPVALMIMDVDHFKAYNDHYGHIAGDECLIRLSKTIRDTLSRSTDMVARYGGEEFVLLLSETGKDEAVKVAEMLRLKIDALGIPHMDSPVSNHVTVSIGVACAVPSAGSSHEDLLRTADRALYQAKSAGRNRVDLTQW